MKLLSFFRLGEPSFGIEKDSGIVDLGERLKNKIKTKSIVDFLTLDSASSIDKFVNLSPDYSLVDITFLPVIPRPNKIMCIGLNYETHRVETKREKSGYPTIFTRFADSQTAHNQFLVKPDK